MGSLFDTIDLNIFQFPIHADRTNTQCIQFLCSSVHYFLFLSSLLCSLSLWFDRPVRYCVCSSNVTTMDEWTHSMNQRTPPPGEEKILFFQLFSQLSQFRCGFCHFKICYKPEKVSPALWSVFVRCALKGYESFLILCDLILASTRSRNFCEHFNELA